jgi:hypothetical protein
VRLEGCPLSLVSIMMSYLNRNVAAPSLEYEINSRGYPLRSTRDTLYPQKLAPTSSTCGCRSVGIVRLQTKDTELFDVVYYT